MATASRAGELRFLDPAVIARNRRITAWAHVVNCAGGEFFSGAGRPSDQD